MKHLDACPWLTDVTASCECAERRFLADATPDERAAWDAAHGRITVGHQLDVSQVQWRGRT
jgi:hypothetical protein